jgi:alpha-D-ribose 1-methylphosphonate 5-triphosphate synthase subunit PhnG
MEREQLNHFLQQVPHEEILSLSSVIEQQVSVELIQKPVAQTLLVPVRDPVNRGSFIGGEVLVTSAIVRVNEVNGWSMVMDENHEIAVAAAILDGAFAAGIQREEIVRLARRGKDRMEKKDTERNAKVNATRVSFDLL